MFDKKDQGRWWDFGWQLIEGCTKVSPACANCWSLEKEKRFGIPKEVIFHPERLDRPLKRKKPTSYAIWNDLFHEDISFKQIDDVIGIISRTPQHIFILLTKRPKRALEFFKWFGNQIAELGFDSIPTQSENPFDYYSPLENVWMGVTSENQEQADNRIPILLQIPAAKRFVSIEPMLGEIDLTKYLLKNRHGCPDLDSQWPDSNGNPRGPVKCVMYPKCKCGKEDQLLNWVICGGESGHNARPMHPDWVRSIRDQCKEANVPFFFKQWGEWYTKWIDQRNNNPIFKMYGSYLQFTQKIWVNKGDCCIDSVGKICKCGGDFQNANYPVAIMSKVGKSKSGSELDGRHYKEFPE